MSRAPSSDAVKNGPRKLPEEKPLFKRERVAQAEIRHLGCPFIKAKVLLNLLRLRHVERPMVLMLPQRFAYIKDELSRRIVSARYRAQRQRQRPFRVEDELAEEHNTPQLVADRRTSLAFRLQLVA